LTSKEKQELISQEKDWRAFANLLDKTTDDLKRAVKFEETCEIIENFVNLGNKAFKGQNEKIDEIIDGLREFVDDARTKMRKLNQEAKPVINRIVEVYNSEYHGESTFTGDVDQWFNRTFPLIRLYVNKNL